MNDLLKQYQMLSNEEKNAILLYNSQLRELINAIGEANEEELSKVLLQTYEDYRKIASNPNNYFLKSSLLFIIDDTSVHSFLNSISKIKETINNVKSKIILSSDMIVFRGISIEAGTGLNFFSKNNLFSTSTNLNNSRMFLIPNTQRYFEVIKLKAGTSVIICPYSLNCQYEQKEDIVKCLTSGIKPNFLSIDKNYDDSEILLFKDELNIESERTNNNSENEVIIKEIITTPKKVVDKIYR